MQFDEGFLRSLLDPLTGAGSRQYTEATIRMNLAGSDRNGLSSGLLLVGVDRLWDIRKRQGPKAADAVLGVVSRTLKGALRMEDFLGRWEENAFLVVLASAKPARIARVARHLRSLVTRSTVPGVPSVSLTVSIGATVIQAGDNAESVIQRVEKLARKAREGGGDRTESELEESDLQPDARTPPVEPEALQTEAADVPEEAGPPLPEPDAAPRSDRELERQLRIRTIPLYVPPEFRATTRTGPRPT